MRYLKKFLKPYTAMCIIGPLCKLFEAIMELYMPIIMVQIIDVGIPSGENGYILRRGALMLVLAAAGLCLALVCQYSAIRASQGSTTAMRSALYAHINTLSQRQLDELGADTLTTRLTNDITNIQNGVAMVIRICIRAPFISVGSVVAASLVDFRLSLIIAASIPAILFVLWFVMSRTTPRYTALSHSLDLLSKRVRENISGVRVIRAFGRSEQENARVNRAADEVLLRGIRVARFSSLMMPLTTLLMNAAVIAVIWFGGKRVYSGAMTSGEIVAFITYATQILTALIAVAGLAVILTRARASLERVSAVFDVPAPEKSEEPVQTDVSAPAIEFERVSFGYTKTGERVIENFDIKIMRGEHIGVIGTTGSGKSTFAKLAARLYTPDSGKVLLFGKDIDRYPRAQLADSISFALQTPKIISGSVEDNIRFARDDLSDECIKSAAENAQAAEFIEKMPEKYKSLIGRAGSGLSGGQKQRIALARALAKPFEILILDDTASALDFATEVKLRRAIDEKYKDKTVITISQRVRSVAGSDRILIMDNGKIVGFAPHDVLIEECPEYLEIVRSQQEG